jgi:hypothetical protein
VVHLAWMAHRLAYNLTRAVLTQVTAIQIWVAHLHMEAMLHRPHATSIMNRRKAEQFRKAKNNFFHRGHQICYKSEAKMYVLIERKGKFYRFTNSTRLLHISQAEIVSSADSKHPAPGLIVSGGWFSHVKNCGRLLPTL